MVAGDGRITYAEFLASDDTLTKNHVLTEAIKKVAAATVDISKIYDEEGKSVWSDEQRNLGAGTVVGNHNDL